MEVNTQVGGVDHLPDLVSVPVANHGVELAGLHQRPGHVRHDTDFQPPLYSADSYGDKGEDEKADDAVINLTDEPATVPFDIKSGAQLPDIDGAIDEPNPLTVRAILVGSCLGAIVGASNIYLGLKTGWTFSSSLFGAILGFAIIKSLSRVLPVLPFGLGGGYFGPKENVTVQTAATSAAGIGIIFVGGVPAIYQLGLLSTPAKDLGRWIGFCAVSAFYGMTFALPLRHWYILKLKLVFPTPTATALTIRALHSAGGEIAARKKAICTGLAFVGSIVLRVVSEYAPGILWDWHVFYWLHSWGWGSVIAADNYGWYYELTPAFHGVGILSGMNASISFYAGSLLAWGIIAPSIVATGHARGRDLGDGMVSYASMAVTPETAKTNAVSPRYWLLWIGVLVMIVASFVELFLVIGLSVRDLWKAHKANRDSKFVDDPSPPEDKISWKIWAPLLVVMIIVQCAVLGRAFGMPVGVSILSILLGFIWSFIACQSSGLTDINPVSTTAKLSQLVVGGATQHGNWPVNAAGYMPHVALLNMLSGCVSGAAAGQSSDMLGDLRTAHLLKAKPKIMFAGQICGAIVSVFLVPGLFVLFSTAYPCILDSTAETCEFAGPSIAAWRAVAITVASKDGLPIPPSSGYTAIGLAIAAATTVVVKIFFIPQKYHVWVPNWVAMGLAFTLAQTQYGAAMAATSIASYFWQKRWPASHEMYAFALAAGLCAGEGIGGCFNALLTICKVDGSLYGSSVGCPGGEYCG